MIGLRKNSISIVLPIENQYNEYKKYCQNLIFDEENFIGFKPQNEKIVFKL